MSVSADTGSPGRIITFYSYKGGTGRTMALANVAWLLATNGHRVLAIDWDLESPGLHRYFHPFLKDKNLTNSEGILDLVRKYADTALRSEVGPGELRSLAQIQEYAASLDWEFPHGGQLDFVPPGRHDLGYTAAVSTFDWDSFWRRLDGGKLLDALREDMARRYDFVLIDSRTGTSDTGGICTVQLPDTVVNCFTLNTQSINGAAAITDSIRLQNPEITVYPVPTRIEDGEKAKLERGRAYSRRKFEEFMDFLGDQPADAYWNSVEVPYIPYYAYEEILAVFGDVPRQNGPLLDRYVRLAGLIAGRDCPAAIIPESERARVLSAFEQSAPQDRRTIVVAYAPLDRIWAEWLRDRLSRTAHRILLHDVRESLPDLESLHHLAVIYSRDLVARESGLRLLRVVKDRIAAGEKTLAAVLRVDATPTERRVQSQALVDVMGVGEERVLESITSTLALDPGTVSGGTTPTAVVRYPAEAAPHFQVALTRNPRFSGRGDILEDIRERLVNSGPHGARLALTGLPGVGKTQTALEYVYRFAASYDGIWWISATQPARVRLALANIATELKLTIPDNVEEQVSAVLDALRKAAPVRRWLVVMDNVDAPADLAGLLPTGPGHIIVTSRNPQWSNDLDTIDVGVFKRAESVELIGRRVQNVAIADAERLASRLGDLPLALEQAGGWLGSTAMSVSDYLDLLDQSTGKAMAEGAPSDYAQTIASTVTVAYEALTQQSPAAGRLIELLAFMAPEVIPYRMISNKQLTALLAPIDPRMYDPARHGSLIQAIGRLGLARVDATTNERKPDPARRGVVVHRLTQDIVRSRLSQPAQADRRQEIQSVLADYERGNPDSPDSRAAYEAIRPHLEPSGALTSDRPESRQLIIDMVRYLWIRGDFAGCQELAEAALKEWLQRSGPDDTWVLRLQRALALALRDQGYETRAHEINADTLERLRRTLGEDDQYTLTTASSYGADLRARGEYEMAVDLDEQTAARLRRVMGNDEGPTLAAVSNVAVSKRFVGEFAEAARLDRECLERRRKLLGPKEIATISSQENLGSDLIELGDLGPARDQLEQGYETCLTEYGPGHLRTLRIANSYSVALRRLDLVDQAAAIIDAAVRAGEVSLGRQHRTMLNCRLEQADVRWAEGHIAQARAIGEEAYADFRKGRGESHPDPLAAGNDLAIFRRLDGDLEGALSLAERVFERLEALFRPTHTYTIAGMITLANAQWATGSPHLAAQTDAAVLKRARKAFPDSHPAVLAAMVNWAISHRSAEPDAAVRFRDEAVDLLTSTLGARHSNTVAAAEWQRIDQDIYPFAI